MSTPHKYREKLLRLVEKKFGYKPKTPNDFNELILAVKSITGKSLSLSTVKRLWGYVAYESMPSLSTLGILAKFLGYRDWEHFCTATPDSDSDFINSATTLKGLQHGATVSLEWEPCKGCTLRHISTNRFVVTEAHNIKLKPGDELTVEILSTGQPVYMKDIIRNGRKIPLYIAAKKTGLKTIRFKT